jgi:membrane protease YdiL (CAAX protease family)
VDNAITNDAVVIEPASDRSESDLSPNDPSWGIPAAIAMWLFSIALIIIVPAFFIFPYLITLPGGTPKGEDMLSVLTKDPTAIFLQVIAVIPAHILTFAAAWFLITRAKRDSFTKALGWRSGGFRWWHYIAITVGFFILMTFVGQYIPVVEDDLTRIAMSSRAALYSIAIMAVFTAPIVEEVIYRGLLYSAFQRKVGAFFSVILVTALFTSVHIPQYWENPSKIALIAGLSLVLTLMRAASGNLLPAIILHTMFNSISALQMVLEPYLKTLEKTDAPAAFIQHLLK